MSETTGRKGVSHLKTFFGLKPGQTLAEFAAETKQLTDEDFDQLVSAITDGSGTY